MKYKIGDKVRIKSIDWYNENKDETGFIIFKYANFVPQMSQYCGAILTINQVVEEFEHYIASECGFVWKDEMIERLVEEEMGDMGEVSDGYHTFNELYEYRLLYNASFFNELAKQNLYDVHKSKKHSDGEDCFGGGHFIVMAELPTGQISNHYELKDWSLFQVPEKEKANKWDGHTPQDVAKRMREFLTPKPKYPKTYEECCDIFGYNENLKIYRPFNADIPEYDSIQLFNSLETLRKLLICRDAYWKIAGAEMGLSEPWKPDWNDCTQHKFGLYTLENEIRCINLQVLKNIILVFPTEEMRDAFYVNFKELIESLKELL